MSLFKKQYNIVREDRENNKTILKKITFKRIIDHRKTGCDDCWYYNECGGLYILKNDEYTSIFDICAVKLKGNYYVPS